MVLHHIRTLIPEFRLQPIPGLSLSAGGLLALADLQTIAQRTAIAGGSSWLDSLVLAPGLHYQQAADSLLRESDPSAVEYYLDEGSTNSGHAYSTGRGLAAQSRTAGQGVGPAKVQQEKRLVVRNAATLNYMERVAKHYGAGTNMVTLDVVQRPEGRAMALLGGARRRRRRHRRQADMFPDDDIDMDWLSHLLYLSSPFLTIVAIVFMVLLEDWWGTSFIAALMLARILNIFIIKQRAKYPKDPIDEDPAHHPDGNSRSDHHNKLTEYYVELSDRPGTCIRLRGMASDLEAITASAWLRAKTYVEGWLEAAAKLIVWMVAALSGNLSQAGAIVLMSLLLVSSALLALSNSHALSFRMRGRVAQPRRPDGSSVGGGSSGLGPPYPVGGSDEWPAGTSAATSDSGLKGMDDWAEKGQIGHVVRDPYPFDDRVEYN